VSLFPIVADLGERYPKVEFVISEYEPIEAFALLTDVDLDLALTYDCNLARASIGPVLEMVPLWSVAWGLGVPADALDARVRAPPPTVVPSGSLTQIRSCTS
jgi:DNA-binding transcriptional LysR family regulator